MLDTTLPTELHPSYFLSALLDLCIQVTQLSVSSLDLPDLVLICHYVFAGKLKSDFVTFFVSLSLLSTLDLCVSNCL